MDIVTRLKKFIDYLGMAYSQFADSAQIPRPTLSQILNGRNKKISNELITKLHETFPTLNIMWLMFGDGEMVTDGNIKISQPQEQVDRSTDTLFMPHPEIDSCVRDTEEYAPYGSHGVVHTDMNATTSAPESYTAFNAPDRAFNDYSEKRKSTMSTADESLSSKSLRKDPVADKEREVNKNETAKRVAYIMVFYSDNSYEMFTPGGKDGND